MGDDLPTSPAPLAADRGLDWAAVAFKVMKQKQSDGSVSLGQARRSLSALDSAHASITDEEWRVLVKRETGDDVSLERFLQMSHSADDLQMSRRSPEEEEKDETSGCAAPESAAAVGERSSADRDDRDRASESASAARERARARRPCKLSRTQFISLASPDTRVWGATLFKLIAVAQENGRDLDVESQRARRWIEAIDNADYSDVQWARFTKQRPTLSLEDFVDSAVAAEAAHRRQRRGRVSLNVIVTPDDFSYLPP